MRGAWLGTGTTPVTFSLFGPKTSLSTLFWNSLNDLFKYLIHINPVVQNMTPETILLQRPQEREP
jgi:hypothetical protein